MYCSHQEKMVVLPSLAPKQRITKGALKQDATSKEANKMDTKQNLPGNKISGRSATPNIPEKKFRAGAISATVWKNQGQNQDKEQITYKTVSFERNYKDNKGNWQTTSSLRINDLPKAVLVLGKAYEYLALNDNNTEEEDAC